jgi:hypothetical protein
VEILKAEERKVGLSQDKKIKKKLSSSPLP